MSTKDNMNGFTALHTVDGLIRMTFSKNGLLLSQSALSSLHNAPFVDIFISTDKKKLMMKRRDKPTDKSVALNRPSNNKSIARMNHKKFNGLLMDWTGCDTAKHSYSIQGRYIVSKDATIFDLNTATEK